MKFSTISNIGKRREENEDAYGNISVGDIDFFIVAYGMGGHSKGEVASKLASLTYIDFIKNADLSTYKSIEDLQEEAISKANDKIYELADDSEGRSMGTTVVCLSIDNKNKKYIISHVGDSRVYLFRDGDFIFKTRDHSLVNDLVDSGSLTEDEAKNFINKSAITRAVGTEDELEVDTEVIDMVKGDVLLLFTDGLSNEVADEEIRTVVNDFDDAYEISSKLVELALNEGGHDNITLTTVLI